MTNALDTKEGMDAAVAFTQKALARIAKKARLNAARAALAAYYSGGPAETLVNAYESGAYVIVENGVARPGVPMVRR